jgi:hypothetical protein
MQSFANGNNLLVNRDGAGFGENTAVEITNNNQLNQ